MVNLLVRGKGRGKSGTVSRKIKKKILKVIRFLMYIHFGMW